MGPGRAERQESARPGNVRRDLQGHGDGRPQAGQHRRGHGGLRQRAGRVSRRRPGGPRHPPRVPQRRGRVPDQRQAVPPAGYPRHVPRHGRRRRCLQPDRTGQGRQPAAGQRQGPPGDLRRGGGHQPVQSQEGGGPAPPGTRGPELAAAVRYRRRGRKPAPQRARPGRQGSTLSRVQRAAAAAADPGRRDRLAAAVRQAGCRRIGTRRSPRPGRRRRPGFAGPGGPIAERRRRRRPGDGTAAGRGSRPGRQPGADLRPRGLDGRAPRPPQRL